MRVESLHPMDPKKVLRGTAAGTVLSIAAMTSGIFGWVRQDQSQINQECNSAIQSASHLSADLIHSGSLGVEGLIFSHVEVRNPTDPKVTEWGRLQNEKDRVCAEARDYNNKPLNQLSRDSTIVGGVITLFGLSIINHQRKRLKTESAQLPQPASS